MDEECSNLGLTDQQIDDWLMYSAHQEAIEERRERGRLLEIENKRFIAQWRRDQYWEARNWWNQAGNL